MSCEQCMLSSCLKLLNTMFALWGFKNVHPMMPVTVTTYWYDNYGLAVLQQLLLLLLLLLRQQSLTQQV